MTKGLRGATLAWLALLPACKGSDSDLPAPYRRIEVPGRLLSSPEARREGRELFLRYCALCHGVNADGRGVRKEGFDTPPVDFTSAAWRLGMTPRKAFYTISEGMHGKGMPSWKGALSAEQSWELTSYVLSVARQEP